MDVRPLYIVSFALCLSSICFSQSIRSTLCSDCATMPKAISIPKPVLTKEIRAEHLSGKVVLSISISEKGDVYDVQLISGNEQLAQAATESARKAKFVPSRSVGLPHRSMRSNVQITYNFVSTSLSTKNRQ
jgi:TonB family protein